MIERWRNVWAWIWFQWVSTICHLRDHCWDDLYGIHAANPVCLRCGVTVADLLATLPPRPPLDELLRRIEERKAAP